MKRFDPNVDDPLKYDIEALDYLKSKHLSLLVGVKDQLLHDEWFQKNVNDRRLGLYVNWEILARQLLVGFAVAEALRVPFEDTLNLCTYYAKCRLIPIQLLNHVIDRLLYDNNFPEPNIYIAELGIVSLAAQLEGYARMAEIRQGTKFWESHVEHSGRVVKFFHEELTRRFDTSILKSPDALLEQYNTKASPLMRSSILETFMRGMAAMNGRQLVNTHWLQQFEEVRQLLDDLADLWDDLLMGRLNYPILAALKYYGPQSELEILIENIWVLLKEGQPRDEFNLEWQKAKELLNDAGVFQQTTNLISDWLSQVEKSIYAEQFSGDIQGLIAIVDLKKAYLTRLIKLDFDNVEPEFQFFN